MNVESDEVKIQQEAKKKIDRSCSKSTELGCHFTPACTGGLWFGMVSTRSDTRLGLSRA